MHTLPATPQPANPPPENFVGPDPRNYAGDPDVAKRALQAVLGGMAACQRARGELTEKWRTRYAAWRAVRKKRNYRGRANITDPEPSKAIETIVSRIEDAVLNQYPYARGIPREMMDRDQVEIAESLIQGQLDQNKAETKLQELIKNTAIFGTGIMRVTWDEQVRHLLGRRAVDAQVGSMNTHEVVSKLATVAGPKVRNIDIEDLYVPNLHERDIENQDFVIEKTTIAVRELRAIQNEGVLNLEAVRGMDYAPGLTYDDSIKAEKAEIAGHDIELPPDGTFSALKKAELLMYEGAFDINGDGHEEDCWIWVANEKTVIKVQENPYWHGERSYVKCHYILAPGQFYGVSLFEWIDSLWAELCDTHNQNLDNKTLILNPAVVAGVGSGMSETRLMLSPGRVIRSAGLASEIQPFAFPDMTGTGWQAAGIMRNMIRETTGATDLLQGSGPGTDKATIFTGMLAEANQRIKHILRNIFAQAVQPLFQKIYALDNQYLTTRQVVRLVGRPGFEFRPIHPEDLGKQLDFRAVGTGTLASVLQKNFGLERFFQVAAPYIQSGQVQVNVQALLERYWTDALGYTDGDIIFSSQGPQPLNPEQENLLIEQRQAVDLHPEDDDVGHIKAHIPLTQIQDTLVKEQVVAHIQEHMAAAKRKIQEQQMMQALQMAQMLMAGGQGGQPAPGSLGGGGGGQAQPANPLQRQKDGNRQRFGPERGGAKEIAEKMAGRQG